MNVRPIVVDHARRRAAIERLRQVNGTLPTWTDLALPDGTDAGPDVSAVDPDAPDPANLWRVHWFNDAARSGRSSVPAHLVLPAELTGVGAPIVVLIGRRFPMIGAHKVLAAYA
jgi:hypothetical protein